VFASYEFRARRVRTKDAKYFDGFNPAISPKGSAGCQRGRPTWRSSTRLVTQRQDLGCNRSLGPAADDDDLQREVDDGVEEREEHSAGSG